MRTVTFSDAAVVKSLNASFVCAWTNKRPLQQFKDGLYAGKETRELPNGTAKDNVTSVFAAWDGTVIHAISGSLDTKAFKHHLAFARDLYDKMYEGVGLRAFGGAVYTEEHKAAARKAADDHAYQTHMRLSKELRGIKDWYPTIFEMLFGKSCND